MDHQERLTAALSDRYRIEREIGRGGMATVYLAHDLRHDRPVAVKVLDPELGRSLGAERFLREIKTTANLTHPHILPVHDSGEADSLLYYVMPYVEGESLRSRLRAEGALPVEGALRIAREIAGALAYAHEQGVIVPQAHSEAHRSKEDFSKALAMRLHAYTLHGIMRCGTSNSRTNSA